MDPTRKRVHRNPSHVKVLMVLLMKKVGVTPKRSNGGLGGSFF
jgi:hypothetical protein